MSAGPIRELRPLQPGEPLTLFGYSVHCSRYALEHRRVARVFVQVRKQGATLCGQVLQCDHFDSGEFFKVATQAGAQWCAARHTRLCSGDGRCTCEASS
ncbi:MAG: hypothetical protein M3N82_00395 [Pseudomonadota bacterium]|nr:hypothetical protein [Pseudomonadota bacterium]